MRVEVREDSVFISGYVNAVERLSKPIRETLHGKIRTFLERIKAGVFRTALKRNRNVLVLLNHDNNRVLASTEDGNAVLEEDNIGLRAEITITDKEVVQKAREGKLSGWSFGFIANDDVITTEGDDEIRTVTDLELLEVSILDDTKAPAYYGTSIEAREGGARMVERRDGTVADIMVEAQEKHEEVVNQAEANWEDERKKHIEIDAEAETKKIELFASMVAAKVIEALKTEEKAEEEEVPTEETTEEETPEEEPAEEPATDTEEKEDEKRSIDYSDFESRLAKLKK